MGELRDFRHLAKIPNDRWAYLAGLFAGEGCFMLREQQRIPRFGLQITMTDEAIVRDVHTTWGGALDAAGMHGKNGRLRSAYAWRVHDGYFVQAITRRILPYMVGEKRAQGEAFLTFVNAKLECWEQKGTAVSYSAEARLKLFRLALVARNFAQGAAKGWRPKWESYIAQLEHEVRGGELIQ